MGVIQSINNVRLLDFYGAAPGGVVFIDTFDTPALLPEWTTLLGTPANNAGALQATATADDAYNLALNAEWTVDTSNWTAAASTDWVRVTTMGPSIAVQYCKAGETAWSHACAYTGMATGNSATLHGLGLLVSATDSFAYYEEVPL